MSRRRPPYIAAPPSQTYPLAESDLRLLERLDARGDLICGLCNGHDTFRPIGPNAIAYCRSFCRWRFPWDDHAADCPKFNRRSTTHEAAEAGPDSPGRPD